MATTMEARRARRNELVAGRNVMKNRIMDLHKSGMDYPSISRQLNIRESTVRQVIHECSGTETKETTN